MSCSPQDPCDHILDNSQLVVRRAVHACGLPENLERALNSVMVSEQMRDTAQMGCSLFSWLTHKDPEDNIVKTFLQGWQDILDTKEFVFELALRLQRTARHTPASMMNYMQASSELNEIVMLDNYLYGADRESPFQRMAIQLSGDSSWQDAGFADQACKDYRTFARRIRKEAPLQDGILTTFAAEAGIAGLMSCFRQQLMYLLTDQHELAPHEARRIGAFAVNQTTETAHLRCKRAIHAWKFERAAVGKDLAPEAIVNVFESQFTEFNKALKSLTESLMRIKSRVSVTAFEPPECKADYHFHSGEIFPHLH